ncbi:MAG: Tol-Pal system beta propeller repeat protein TolB [Desulfamplus sp.]|nr:Tol-Pal system beta propeller repeat protein TolB [Desulfamplus sp.]
MSQNISINFRGALNSCRFFLLRGLLCVLVFFPAVGMAQHAYININDPLMRKIPVAVPFFKAFTGHEQEVSLGKNAVDIMSNALDFTGYLAVLDKASFIENPAQKGITGAEINYKNWTVIGAELLITGGIVEQNGTVRLELRLFDTFKETLLIGKVYTGNKEDIKSMVYRFCAEISLLLTGKMGVFGSRIAFVSTVKGNKEIFTCDFDGGNISRVTNFNNITISPAWSFDGNFIAFTSYAKGTPALYIRDLRSNSDVVLAKKGLNITPAWIPGQFALAATLSFSGDQDIYIVSGTGQVKNQLTKVSGIDVSPAFSPDGGRFAFVSKRSGTPQIYIGDTGSGSATRLTFQGNYNTSPAWSPDGEKIAYVGVVKNSINIYVIGVNGGGPTQLTSGQGDNEDPSWSPDGNLIAFSSTRQGASRIFVMTATGADQRLLFTLGGSQTEPTWSSGVGNNK